MDELKIRKKKWRDHDVHLYLYYNKKEKVGEFLYSLLAPTISVNDYFTLLSLGYDFSFDVYWVMLGK